MDLQKMQYFKDVFELNSFTKAADKNFVYSYNHSCRSTFGRLT